MNSSPRLGKQTIEEVEGGEVVGRSTVAEDQLRQAYRTGGLNACNMHCFRHRFK